MTDLTYVDLHILIKPKSLLCCAVLCCAVLCFARAGSNPTEVTSALAGVEGPVEKLNLARPSN